MDVLALVYFAKIVGLHVRTMLIVCGYGYVLGYPRKICGYKYGYEWEISYSRHACLQSSRLLYRKGANTVELSRVTRVGVARVNWA